MYKTKTIVTTLIIIIATTALATTTASAMEWQVNGTTLTGSAALATTAKVDASSVLELPGIVTITCTGSTLNGIAPQIEAPNKDSASSLEFTGCGTGGGNCTLGGQNAGGKISTLPVTAEVTLGTSPTVLATFKPKGSLFFTLKFTGSKCSFSGEEQFKGSILAELPTGLEEKTAQLISAITIPSTGMLKVGSDSAGLSGASLLKLTSGNPWSF